MHLNVHVNWNSTRLQDCSRSCDHLVYIKQTIRPFEFCTACNLHVVNCSLLISFENLSHQYVWSCFHVLLQINGI